MHKVFSNLLFFRALDAKRKARKMAWNKVAIRAGVTPSSLQNFAQQFEKKGYPPKGLSLETFILLMNWMGVTDFADFLVDEDDAE